MRTWDLMTTRWQHKLTNDQVQRAMADLRRDVNYAHAQHSKHPNHKQLENKTETKAMCQNSEATFFWTGL